MVNSSEAAKHVGAVATVYGKVIEVRRVANGPIIFEIDGKPGAPAFRALVYPMATPRFESTPEKAYLGALVEVTGPIVVRNDLAQVWMSDPSHIRLRKADTAPDRASPPDAQAAPAATPAAPK